MKVSYKPSFPDHLLPEIVVTPNHVTSALIKGIQGQASADDLEEWATHLILGAGFDLRPEVDVEMDDVVLEVIHLLAAPDFNRALTSETLQYYLSCIDTRRHPDD